MLPVSFIEIAQAAGLNVISVRTNAADGQPGNNIDETYRKFH